MSRPVLRPWQERHIAHFFATDDQTFLNVAVPGAGKTDCGLAIARRLLDEGTVQRVAIAVPTATLAPQIIRKAGQWGIKLDATNNDKHAAEPRGHDGTVATYGAIAHKPSLHARQCEQKTTFAIIEEPHHLARNAQWGHGVEIAFHHAYRRLLQTATAWRTVGYMPWLDYDANGLIDHDLTAGAEYGFREAWAEPDELRCIREVEFDLVDSVTHWRANGSRYSCLLSELDPEADEFGTALRGAYRASSDFMNEILTRANADLEARRESRTAAALVLAYRQERAKEYRGLLRALTGKPPCLVISEDTETDSSAEIKAFAEGSDAWLDAVRQPSEGVDIPRLEDLVFCSDWTTRLFSHQAYGRVLRRPSGDRAKARIFLPACKPFVTYAAELETFQAEAARERERRNRQREDQEPRPVRFESLDATDAEYAGAMTHKGERIAPEIADAWRAVLPPDLKQNAAAIALANGCQPPAEEAAEAKGDNGYNPAIRAWRKARLNALVNTAGEQAYWLADPYETINRYIGKRWDYRDQISDDDLKAAIEFMEAVTSGQQEPPWAERLI